VARIVDVLLDVSLGRSLSFRRERKPVSLSCCSVVERRITTGDCSDKYSSFGKPLQNA